MPAIKITLNRLIELFGKSVNSDLPESVRALAARLMTLTAHTMRIDQKIDARVKTLSEQIATLTEVVHALTQPQGAPAAATTAPVEASTPTAAASTNEAPAEEPSEEEEDEAAFFARAQQEAEAEVAAINAAAPVAEVTPLPRSKKAGGAK